jgi:hypothetical protein
MFSLGLLILWSAAGEREQTPEFSESDRTDVAAWANARGYSLEPIAASEAEGDIQNV